MEEKSFSTLPLNLQRYLNDGKRKLIDKRYKCKLRKYWYSVPSVWVSDGFFVKRTDLYPKILVNTNKACVTDAFYRIRMKNGFDIKSLTLSFYNTLSFIFAELEGRFYGGGVLELTPNEFKKLPVPYVKVGKEKFYKFEKIYNNREPADNVRKYIDKTVLSKHFKLNTQEINKLNTIYKKLVNRRLKK